MKYLLTLLFFALPLVWFKGVNANYLTTKTFLLYLVAGLSLFALPHQLTLRKIPRGILVCGALLILWQLCYYILDYSYYGLLYSMKTISFLALTLYFYSLNLSPLTFLRKNTMLIGATLSIIIAVTSNEIYQGWQAGHPLMRGGVVSTFGNVNMLAEFLILILPLLFLWQRQPDGVSKVLKILLMAAVICLLIFCNSRSAWMGLGLFLMAKIYFGLERREWTVLGFMVLIAGGILLYVQVTRGTFIDFDILSRFKNDSTSERMLIYRGSFDLLLARPLGIPIAAYSSEIVPFMSRIGDVFDNQYHEQPHSELLKWGIQFGWAYLLLALVLLVFVAKQIRRAIREEKNEEKRLFFEFALVFLPQIIFQFAFENPASLMVIALILGMFLSQFEVSSVRNISKIQFVTAAIGLVVVTNAFVYFGAMFVSSVYAHTLPDMARLSCKVYPERYESCLLEQQHYLQLRRPDLFRQRWLNSIEKVGLRPDYLNKLPMYYEAGGNTARMCEAVQMYSHLYKKQQSFNANVLTYCLNYRPPFDFSDTKNFMKNYLNWLRH